MLFRSTVKYYYDGDSTRVLYETDGNGNLLVRYIFDQNGRIVSMVRGGTTYFYHYNYRGDVVALTNSTGTVVAEYDYDAYGVPVATGLEGTIENTIRYAGYRWDEETGLYYLNARYYAPEIGRFITRDAFHGFEDDPASLNQYNYAHSNPVMFVDPSGYIAISAIIGGLIGLGVGAFLLPAMADARGLTGFNKYAFVGLGTAALTVVGGTLGYYAGKAITALYAQGGMFASSMNSALVRLIAKLTGGTYSYASGNGYKIKLGNYLLRIMSSGGGRVNYFRLSHITKGSMTIYGSYSNNRALTHIPITLNNIVRMVKLLRGL